MVWSWIGATVGVNRAYFRYLTVVYKYATTAEGGTREGGTREARGTEGRTTALVAL